MSFEIGVNLLRQFFFVTISFHDWNSFTWCTFVTLEAKCVCQWIFAHGICLDNVFSNPFVLSVIHGGRTQVSYEWLQLLLGAETAPLLPSPPPLLLATDDILPSCYVRVSARTIGPHSLPKEWGRPYSRLKKKEEKKKLMNEALCSFIPCPYFNGTCNTANRVFAFSLSLLTFSSLSSRFRRLNSVTWLWVIVYCTCATVDVVYMYVKTKPTVI